MLVDSPPHYLRSRDHEVSAVPTVWHDTKVLHAKMGDYVAIARRHNRDWYVGAMTDWTPRELEIDFSFLPAGAYQLEAYEDGANADRSGSDYRRTIRAVNRNTKLRIKLVGGGGWAAHISSAKQRLHHR